MSPDRAKPTAQVEAARKALEERHGLTFRDGRLLSEALRHASAAGIKRKRSNERLEFLGDRVLGLVVAQHLMERAPDEPEGALTRRLAALVRKETLAEIALEIGLDAWLDFAPGERDGGKKPAILADALEALIAAIFLEFGWKRSRAFVESLIAPRAAAMGRPPEDVKTALQEWTQARSLGLPSYRLLEQSGPSHAPRFVVEARVGEEPPATGTGRSKRAAEREAAAALLERMRAGENW